MSKNNNSQSPRPTYADWTVTLDRQSGNATRGFASDEVIVTGSAFIRTEHGGYTFSDGKGVTAEFPPGVVLHVMRGRPAVEVLTSVRGSMADPYAADLGFGDDPRKRGTAAATAP